MPLHAQLHRRQFNGALEPGYPVSLSREMANGDKERKKQSGPRSSRGPRPPCSLAHSGAAARNYFLGSLELPESSLSRPLCRELRVLLSRDGSGGAGTLLQEAWGWGWGISQTPRGGGPTSRCSGWHLAPDLGHTLHLPCSPVPTPPTFSFLQVSLLFHPFLSSLSCLVLWGHCWVTVGPLSSPCGQKG